MLAGMNIKCVSDNLNIPTTKMRVEVERKCVLRKHNLNFYIGLK